MKLCWSVVLSLVFVGLAAAGPYALQEHLSRFLGEELSQLQETTCLGQTHKVIFRLRGKEYEYQYKACLNHDTEMMCVDSSKNLPPPCGKQGGLTSCVEFEWYVDDLMSTFDICEVWGKPCQKPIDGFMLTDSKGNCDRRAAIQSQVTICSGVNSDGTEDCTAWNCNHDSK